MNKLSFTYLLSEFKKVNPEGDLWYDNQNKLNVVYKKESKVYSYSVKNNADAVNKLKLNIKLMYDRDYNSIVRQMAETKEKIEKGYFQNDWGFFGDCETVAYTDEQINNFKFDIECWEQKIKDVVII